MLFLPSPAFPGCVPDVSFRLRLHDTAVVKSLSKTLTAEEVVDPATNPFVEPRAVERLREALPTLNGLCLASMLMYARFPTVRLVCLIEPSGALRCGAMWLACVFSDPADAAGERSEAVSITMLHQTSNLPAGAALQFVVRRCRLGAGDAVPVDAVLTLDDLAYARHNPLLRELPPVVADALVSDSQKASQGGPVDTTLSSLSRSESTEQYLPAPRLATEVLLRLIENPGLATQVCLLVLALYLLGMWQQRYYFRVSWLCIASEARRRCRVRCRGCQFSKPLVCCWRRHHRR